MDNSELRAELEKHHQDSFGWALACCRGAVTEAENVLQTAYLKVLEGKARFEKRATFKTWLFAVIRNTAAEQRRRRLWQWLSFSGPQELDPSCAEDLGRELYHKELREFFLQALLKLPRRQHEVLHLVFYQELSLSEAAAVMGVGLGSARRHYQRGKDKLREELKEAGFERI